MANGLPGFPGALPDILIAKFVELLFDAVREFVQDDLPKLAKKKEDDLNRKLQTITAGQKFLGFPVVLVDVNSFYVLLRAADFAAKIPDFSGFPPKMKNIPGLKINLARATLQLKRHVNLTDSSQPIILCMGIPAYAVEIAVDWRTYSLALGGGKDEILGLEQYKVRFDSREPPYGLYGYLAKGTSKGGFVLSLAARFPFTIPFGSLPIGLCGVGFTYGERFAPIFSDVIPLDPVAEMDNKTAKDYADWAQRNDLERWAPVKEALRIYGISSDICDVPTNGKLILLHHHGLAFLSYGPSVLMSGTVRIFDTIDINRVIGAIDLRSSSMFLSSTSELQLADGLFELGGSLELSASLRDQNLTWVALGGYAMNGCRVKLVKVLELQGGARLIPLKGTAASMLRAWRNRDDGGHARSPRRSNTQAAIPHAGADLAAENARLRRDNERLRMEREILKKTLRIFSEAPR